MPRSFCLSDSLINLFPFLTTCCGRAVRHAAMRRRVLVVLVTCLLLWCRGAATPALRRPPTPALSGARNRKEATATPWVRSSCGRSCWGDAQCVLDAPFSPCSQCVFGTCSAGAQCGAVLGCSVDYDCRQDGNCARCNPLGTCVHGCGQQCTTRDECVKHGCVECDKAVGAPVGVCRTFGCGGRCGTDADCSALCPFCTNQTCHARCFRNCTTDSMCPAPCPHCTGGVCGTW